MDTLVNVGLDFQGSRLASELPVNWLQPSRADIILMVLIDQECHTSLK